MNEVLEKNNKKYEGRRLKKKELRELLNEMFDSILNPERSKNSEK